jgi:hypothetical protein
MSPSAVFSAIIAEMTRRTHMQVTTSSQMRELRGRDVEPSVRSTTRAAISII